MVDDTITGPEYQDQVSGSRRLTSESFGSESNPGPDVGSGVLS